MKVNISEMNEVHFLSNPINNGSRSLLLLEFLFNSWDVMINTTDAKSNGYLLSEISRNNFSLPSFAWFFEFCTHLSDIAEQLNKTNGELPHVSSNDTIASYVDASLNERVSTLSPVVKTIFVTLVLMTSLASLLGNAISVWVTIRIRSTETTSRFLICLAVSDLLQTFTICASETANILYDLSWIYGNFLCKMIPFVQTASALANALTLSCIAIGRYLAITASLRWRALELRKVSMLTLVFIWSFSIVICLPISFLFEYEPAVHTNVHSLHEHLMSRSEVSLAKRINAEIEFVSTIGSLSSNGINFNGNIAHDDNISPIIDTTITSTNDATTSTASHDSIATYRGYCWWNSNSETSKRIYFFVVPSCMFLPLFLIITVMYSYMARYLWLRKPPGVIELHNTSSNEPTQDRRWRIVKFLALLILVFLCCRGPVQVFNMLQGLKKYNLTAPILVIRNCLTVIKLLNCAINPLLYCLLHDRFKAYLTIYMKRLACRFRFAQKIGSAYSRTGDLDLEDSSNMLADFSNVRVCRPKQTQNAQQRNKKSSLPLKQLAYVEKLGPLLNPCSRQRGELSWHPGQSLTLERLIQNEPHSV